VDECKPLTGGTHGAQVGIVIMVYCFIASILVVYPGYFLFFANRQELTVVHFSAQPEPFPTQNHTLNNP